MGSSVADAVEPPARTPATRSNSRPRSTTASPRQIWARRSPASNAFCSRGDSPVDRFRQRGERSALTAAEIHGLWLYESKGQCWHCHSGTNFTDESFHNTGVNWGGDDLGRHASQRRTPTAANTRRRRSAGSS